MKHLLTTLVAASAAGLVVSCGESGPSGAPAASAAPAASTARAAASSSAAAAASAVAPARPRFAGKLTVEMVRNYKPTLAPSMKLAEARPLLEAELGAPTYSDSRRYVWAAADGAECASFAVEIAGDRVGATDGPNKVASADFQQQWGKMCLLRAGVEPRRSPFTGKTFTVAAYAKEASGSNPVHVEGQFVSAGEDGGFHFVLLGDAKDAEAKVRCKLELGASLPSLKEKEAIVVEGTPRGSSELNECFLVKKP